MLKREPEMRRTTSDSRSINWNLKFEFSNLPTCFIPVTKQLQPVFGKD